MSAAPAESAPSRPVERFKPTSGMFLGWAGIAAAAVAIVYCALSVHTVTGLRIALGALLFALVVWVTQLRPRATAYQHHLVLKNPLRDTTIPLAAIDEVSVRQTLRVVADQQRHVCIGIGVPVREELRRKRKNRSDLLGTSRWGEFIERAERAAPDQTGMTYQTFVVTRIEELVEQEKKQPQADRPQTDRPQGVRRAWAWPEIAALAGVAAAFLVSLFL